MKFVFNLVRNECIHNHTVKYQSVSHDNKYTFICTGESYTIFSAVETLIFHLSNLLKTCFELNYHLSILNFLFGIWNFGLSYLFFPYFLDSLLEKYPAK
jgi:hypothetical protein